jgi:chemotaxis protein CheY-P-specific phosphatase CheC
MKAQQKLDKILESVTEKIQDEVSSLIGASLTLSNSQNTFISKEDFFDHVSGKHIAAKLEVSGDVECSACLLVTVKDAIRLGGTLIMLPQNELDKAISSDDYNEETKDSFGEIANIIAGSYTKVFEEMYPGACRFVRKDQEILIPVKVDIESDHPVVNQLLYRISSSMRLGDFEMGNLTVLLPASPFGLQQAEEAQPQPAASSEKPKETRATAEQAVAEEVPPAASPEELEEPEETTAAAVQTVEDEAGPDEAQAPKPSGAVDIEKHKKRVDSLLNECQTKMQVEVSALLGVELQLSNHQIRPISKEDFFLEEVSGKQVLAHMKVTGDAESESFLFVSLKDAIRIGGILIMLPPAELETSVAEDDYNDDSSDAYNEIANIIAGVYTGFFEENYTKHLRFVRTDVEQVVPLKVDMESDKPIPNQMYYMSSSSLSVEGKALGKVQVLIPLTVLQLEGLEASPHAAGEEKAPVKRAAVSARKEPEKTVFATQEKRETHDNRGDDILLISDDSAEAEKIQAILERANLKVRTLSFKNNVNNHISDNLKAVFLVMHEVGEQAFGVAIKISSSCSVPLIAAGPAWTRSKVIKAVKYGISDILLTPATDDDIQEKIDNNLIRLAA